MDVLTVEQYRRLVNTLEAGRVPSTLTDEEEAFVQQWLKERGHR